MKPVYFIGFLTLALWALYVTRAAPTITIGDSAELAAVGSTLGIGHSPGYPLFAVLTKLGTRALPWGTAAYRVNVISAFWTAACVGLISLCVLQITGSLATTLLIGFLIGSGSLWMNQALVAEVFGLNSFIASTLLFLAIQPPTLNTAALAAYGLGVGLGNHHTLILFAPALLLRYAPVIREQPVKRLSLLLLLFAAGLSIYLYIPLRAQRLPVMDWEEPVTWERFWKLFTRARYGAFQLAQGDLPAITLADIGMQARYLLDVLWQNQGPACSALVLALLGIRQNERRPYILFLVCVFLFTGPFFFIFTHLRVTPRTRAILDRFMYLSLVPVGVLLGLGLDELIRLLRRLHVPQTAAVLLVSLSALAWAGFQPLPYERNNLYVRDFGNDLLRSSPKGTLLFADRADEAEFSLAYLQRAEHARPDITFIDCNAGVSRSIYGPGYYDIWGLPRLAIRTTEERARIAAWPGPVYYATHEPEMIPIPRSQEGLLFAISGRPPFRPRLPWHELLIFRRPYSTPDRPASTDRGLYGDYWNVLYKDSVQAHAQR